MIHPDRIIETARLRLRPFRDADLDDLVMMAGDWEVARWLAAMPHPYTQTIGRNWIVRVRADHAAGPPRSFAIALKHNDRLVGGGGLDGSNAADAAEPALGYWLGCDFWGQGYAREAVSAFVRYGFDVLGLPSISAYTDPANAASQKVLLAAGLERVGEINLRTPTHSGAVRVPFFRVEAAR